MSRVDFEIEEGGMYPAEVFHHCGCVMDADPPRYPAPSGKCECGLKCPKCGVQPKKREHIKFYGNKHGHFELAKLVCPKCGWSVFFRVRCNPTRYFNKKQEDTNGL